MAVAMSNVEMNPTYLLALSTTTAWCLFIVIGSGFEREDLVFSHPFLRSRCGTTTLPIEAIEGCFEARGIPSTLFVDYHNSTVS